MLCSNLRRAGQPKQALAAAQNFAKQRGLSIAFKQQPPTRAHRANGQEQAPAYYAFNAEGKDKGFVIVSADSRTEQILGYSDKGTFTEHDMPENMKAFLQGYKEQMAYLDKHPEAAMPNGRQQALSPISPLLTTKWDQDTYYNAKTTTQGGEKTLAGCVATAMAQVMFLQKFPDRLQEEIPGYTSQSGISVNPCKKGAIIDWNNMRSTYRGRETAEQINAIADFMLYCGTGANMNYTKNFSSAKSEVATQALQKYFGYTKACYKLRMYYSAQEWQRMLYHELSNNRAVMYSGASSGSAHAFVVDGFDGDKRYHINWGWNGNANGFFLLDILNPSYTQGSGATETSDGYGMRQAMVIGIQNPETMKDDEWEQCLEGRPMPVFNKNVSITFSNKDSHHKNFDAGIGYYDESGKIIHIANQSIH